MSLSTRTALPQAETSRIRVPVTLNNTIVANSVAGDNCVGAITSGGHNLDEGSTLSIGSRRETSATLTPLLDELTDNGGNTRTQALLNGSPAIDAGSEAHSFYQLTRGVCGVQWMEMVTASLSPTLAPTNIIPSHRSSSLVFNQHQKGKLPCIQSQRNNSYENKIHFSIRLLPSTRLTRFCSLLIRPPPGFGWVE